MTYQDISILTVAKNAENTIGDALHSLPENAGLTVVLIDSSDNDATYEAAKAAIGCRNIDYYKLPADTPIGRARQQALEKATTPYGLWLDADDAFDGDHISLYINALRGGAEFCVGGLIAAKPKDLSPITAVPVPSIFLNPETPEHILLAFERNWLPSLCAGVNIQSALRIGFDETQTSSEDYDFFQRALMADINFHFIKETSYLYRQHPQGLSRNLGRNAVNLRNSAKKLISQGAIEYIKQNGQNIDLGDYLSACLQMRAQIPIKAPDIHSLKRPRQPAVHPILNINYTRLTSFLFATQRLADGHNMLSFFEELQRANEPHPAFFNNMAVACWRESKDQKRAMALFDQALTLKKGYLDAEKNKEKLERGNEGSDAHITLAPLRADLLLSRYDH